MPQFVCHNESVTSLFFIFYLSFFHYFMCVYFCYFDLLLVFCSSSNHPNVNIYMYNSKRHDIIITKITINVSN